jgi:nitrite reductase/ring-hydroxylating ferredoxin subunit
MDRRDFIRKSCVACLSFTVASTLLSSCASTQFIPGKLVNDGITVSKDDFRIKQKGGTAYSSFIIVQNNALKFPICLYRISDNEYRALWMQCTHQGAELQASGDVLLCSAHGSEFNNRGEVRTGPADKALRTFPVSVTNNEIFIDLRKQS